MRNIIGWLFILICCLAAPALGQTVSAGFNGGITYLGGLERVLGANRPSAPSASLFLDFGQVGNPNVRLGGNVIFVDRLLFSSFETNVFWRFPLGRLKGIVGAGGGMFFIPRNISSTLNLSLQALVGMENDLFDTIVIKITMQALQVVQLNRGFLPGMPLFRIEVGVAFPLL